MYVPERNVCNFVIFTKKNHILSISTSRTRDFPYRQLIFDGKKTTNICSNSQNESQDLGHP